MANDEDIRNPSELAPYSPSQSLAPAPEWGANELSEYTQHPSGQGQTILGQPLPPGVSFSQAVETYKQLSQYFLSDFLQLGHNISRSQKAVNWFMDALTNPPTHQRKLHSYNLFEHSLDPTFQAFANFAHANGFPAKFVQDACWWVSEAGRRFAKQNSQNPVGTQPAPRMATPTTSTEAILNSLSDSDYNKVIKINEQALARTMQVLQNKWGDYTFRQNIEIANHYLLSLPDADQRHFDQFTTGYVHLRNTPEFIIAMFDAATGAHNIPKDGPGIARELAECEKVMRTNRKQWLSDNALQAHYRTLLDMKSRGN
jgi:hypothetical protein